jgi:hypothetical protein
MADAVSPEMTLFPAVESGCHVIHGSNHQPRLLRIRAFLVQIAGLRGYQAIRRTLLKIKVYPTFVFSVVFVRVRSNVPDAIPARPDIGERWLYDEVPLPKLARGVNDLDGPTPGNAPVDHFMKPRRAGRRAERRAGGMGSGGSSGSNSSSMETAGSRRRSAGWSKSQRLRRSSTRSMSPARRHS